MGCLTAIGNKLPGPCIVGDELLYAFCAGMVELPRVYQTRGLKLYRLRRVWRPCWHRVKTDERKSKGTSANLLRSLTFAVNSGVC